ncbi:MAG: hypothetical protein JNM43_12545 [Planctomycetaceae bacterium]|nr:hypothetical protein [Planctomycetaceae bacterium]
MLACMSGPRLVRSAVIAFTLVAILQSPVGPAVAAQDGANDPKEKAIPIRDRVVDRITLRDGTQLLGLALNERPAQLVVRPKVLKETVPAELWQEIETALKGLETTPIEDVVSPLQEEMTRLEMAIPKDAQRISMIAEVLDRIRNRETPAPPLLIIEPSRSRLRKLDGQTPQRRELCKLALLNDLQNFENEDAKTVMEKLRAIPPAQRKIALEQPVQSNAKAADRILAAIDIRLNSVTRLIRSGNSFVNEDERPDPAALLQGALEQNLQSTLGQLLNEANGVGQNTPQASTGPLNDLPATAAAISDAKKTRACVVTEYQFQLDQGTATVHRSLFRKTNADQWVRVLTSSSTATTADIKPGQQDAIKSDPQIQQITSLVQGLGIGDDKLNTALSMGSVVQNALTAVDAQFSDRVQGILTAREIFNAGPIPTVTLGAAPAPVEPENK